MLFLCIIWMYNCHLSWAFSHFSWWTWGLVNRRYLDTHWGVHLYKWNSYWAEFFKRFLQLSLTIVWNNQDSFCMPKINIGSHRSGSTSNRVIWRIDCAPELLSSRYYGGFLFSPFDGTSVRLIVIKVFSFDSRYGPGCAESEIYGDTGA